MCCVREPRQPHRHFQRASALQTLPFSRRGHHKQFVCHWFKDFSGPDHETLIMEDDQPKTLWVEGPRLSPGMWMLPCRKRLHVFRSDLRHRESSTVIIFVCIISFVAFTYTLWYTITEAPESRFCTLNRRWADISLHNERWIFGFNLSINRGQSL